MTLHRTAVLCLSLLPLDSSMAAAEDPFAALAVDTRPLQTRWQTDYPNLIELGVGFVGDDNVMFGQYNGLNDDGANVIANLRWVNELNGSWVRVEGRDLGLDTRTIQLNWSQPGRFELALEMDSQQQIRNDSGTSPFSGGSNLQLPTNWVGANVTSGFDTLGSDVRSVSLESNRDTYRADLTWHLDSSWTVQAGLAYEERDGTKDTGAASYSDASAGHAAILPGDIDDATTTAELGLSYQNRTLQVNASWYYSDYDNSDELLEWQNPYTIFGPDVAYPNGQGGLSLAPDNEWNQGRLQAVYHVSPKLRIQLDGSFARTEQDQDFVDYTVNPNLIVTEPLPRDSFDVERDTSTLDARLYYRVTPKLQLEARYRGEKQDYDGPRDGYRPAPGDGGDQSRSALTVYNSLRDHTVNTSSVETSYRLPWRSKLWAGYTYEEWDRSNAAVEKTEEDIYHLRYRIAPLPSLSATAQFEYGDRAADFYAWDQSYFALLDAELINATPENQRYNNHPLLSQYHLASRERSEARLDVSWQANMVWQLSANLLWREDDYTDSEIGLENEELQRLALTSSWTPVQELSVTSWISYDRYQTQQNGRSFRGGQEKDAFAVTPPLPQASDPTRDWQIDADDDALSLGVSVVWQLREDLELSADYDYLETGGDDDFGSGGAADIGVQPLPNQDTTQHHLSLSGAWALRENLSLTLDYQYWNYDADDWAINGVTPSTIDKVLTLGEQEIDEDLHYIGTSIVFRWR